MNKIKENTLTEAEEKILQDQLREALRHEENPDSFDRLAAYIDSAIRILYNSNKETFNEIFGYANGPYLWDKFTGTYNGDQEGAFICYLDHTNQRCLAIAVAKYAAKNDKRAK